LRHCVWLWPVRVLQTLLDRLPTLRVLAIDGTGARLLTGTWRRAKPEGGAHPRDQDFDDARERDEGVDTDDERFLVLPATLLEYRDQSGNAVAIEFANSGGVGVGGGVGGGVDSGNRDGGRNAPCDLRVLELSRTALPGGRGSDGVDGDYRTEWTTRLARLQTLRYTAAPEDAGDADGTAGMFGAVDRPQVERRRRAWYRALASLPALTDLEIECAPSEDVGDGYDAGFFASSSSLSSSSSSSSSSITTAPRLPNLRRLALTLDKYAGDGNAFSPQSFSFLRAYTRLRDLRVTTTSVGIDEHNAYVPPSVRERMAVERILTILADGECAETLAYLQLSYANSVAFSPPTRSERDPAGAADDKPGVGADGDNCIDAKPDADGETKKAGNVRQSNSKRRATHLHQTQTQPQPRSPPSPPPSPPHLSSSSSSVAARAPCMRSPSCSARRLCLSPTRNPTTESCTSWSRTAIDTCDRIALRCLRIGR
jgi:hypothetical protein